MGKPQGARVSSSLCYSIGWLQARPFNPTLKHSKCIHMTDKAKGSSCRAEGTEGLQVSKGRWEQTKQDGTRQAGVQGRAQWKKKSFFV